MGIWKCKYLILLILMLASGRSIAQNQKFTIDPPFWYKGLKNDSLMLLIHGKNVGNLSVKINGDAAKLILTKTLQSPNYLVIYLLINQESLDTSFSIQLDKKMNIPYVLKKSNRKISHAITSADNMYLIMPDRFANGDLKNDKVEGYSDKLNRALSKGRHGGDLEGIISHLSYLENLGVTSLWINPLVENNQKKASYHGYACTDFYKIDPRFGDLEDYKRLSTEARNSDIGLVMDVVYNHIGDEHRWMKDVPDSNWIHFYKTFTNSNYRAVSLADPHAAISDKNLLSDGWFDETMPDLNQKDAVLNRYLIQNTIWWIETAQLAGLRIDTYAYPDNDFMKKLVFEVKNEFPDCFVFGEIWEIGDASQAWYSPNNIKSIEQQGLDGVTDYSLYFSILKWLNEEEGWSEGLGRIYYTLASDVLYSKPQNMVTFLDNHDQDRFFGKVDGDIKKWKQGIAFLLTTRGLPCIYYGTELLFKESGDHGLLRRDFPGGWPGDTLNKFDSEGRSSAENEAFEYLQNLLMYRKSNPELFKGDLLHFVPEKGVYVYFRTSETKNLMVVLSNAKSDQMISLERFREVLPEEAKLHEIITDVNLTAPKSLWVPAKSVFVAEY